VPEATPLPTPLVSRHRGLFTIGLAAAIGLALVLAVVSILVAPKSKPHLVTIPRADRNASPALVAAAEAIGYRPAKKSDSVERGPISGAPSVPGGLLPLGSVAPAFTLRTPAGAPLRLESLHGKAVLLEFFATWCPHCAAEAPHLARLARSLPAKRYAVVGVNADSEDAASVFAYHVWFGLPFPALVDHRSSSVTWPEHGAIGPVSSRYAVDRFPTFYVLDRNGEIAWRSSGEQPDALLRRQLERAAQT
jgi:thiol-disulfide isomerase/thioredoxin